MKSNTGVAGKPPMALANTLALGRVGRLVSHKDCASLLFGAYMHASMCGVLLMRVEAMLLRGVNTKLEMRRSTNVCELRSSKFYFPLWQFLLNIAEPRQPRSQHSGRRSGFAVDLTSLELDFDLNSAVTFQNMGQSLTSQSLKRVLLVLSFRLSFCPNKLSCEQRKV